MKEKTKKQHYTFLGIFEKKYANYSAFALCALFIIAGILVSLNRYWQYEVFYYNFGVFDQAIWRASRFQAPIIEHVLVGGKWIFADHFNPSILLLAPLYWFTDRSEIVLVAQALFAGLAGLVLYKIGIEVLKDKKLSLSILACYLFFVGIQNAVITDFHEVTVMTLPLAIAIWAIIKKKVVLYFIFLFLVLGFKESTFLLGAGIGIFIYFYNKLWRKIAFATVAISLLWGFLAIKVFIPYFSEGIYLHAPALPSSFTDKIMALVDHPLKRETLFYSFFSFGFLPLASPSLWFVIAQDYIMRFVPLYVETRWSLGLHYNAISSVLLAFSSIFGLSVLKKIKKVSRYLYLFVALLVINVVILFRFVLHGPFLLAINPDFYKHTHDFSFLDNLIKRIPHSVSVMTQNNLATRFTHQKVFLLRPEYENYIPDYVLIDIREGQNPNNFLFSGSVDDTIKKLQKDSRYSLEYSTKYQFIFKRRK